MPSKQKQPASNHLATPCPHCKSNRIHRSHRRGAIDQLLSRVGAQIRRCHDCRHRYAFFGMMSLPLGIRDSNHDQASNALLYGAIFSVCLLVVWWMVRRLTIPAG